MVDLSKQKRDTSESGASAKPNGGKMSSNISLKQGWTNKLLALATAVIAVVVLVVGVSFAMNKDNGSSQIDKDNYQAVFLTNGQVYFGKLQSVGGDYAKLTDIYYLQVNKAQTIQPEKEAGQSDADKDDNGLKLIKLGNEIHGPKDQMEISSKQILFWENMKDDSKVVKAIDSYTDKKDKD